MYTKTYRTNTHKFRWFGCLEEQIHCTVCLLSLQPALTKCLAEYVCCICGALVCKIKILLRLYAACCGLSFVWVQHWVPATPTTPLHHINFFFFIIVLFWLCFLWWLYFNDWSTHLYITKSFHKTGSVQIFIIMIIVNVCRTLRELLGTIKICQKHLCQLHFVSSITLFFSDHCISLSASGICK